MMWLTLVILVVVALAATLVVIDKRRSTQLRARFGPEYERAVDRHGDRRAAESELRERLARRRDTDLRELTPEDRDRYAQRWQRVQAAFVDDPRRAVNEAALLVEQVMAERGYLGTGTGTDVDVDVDGDGDGEGDGDRYELVAVDHPELVERFRSADASGSADDLREEFLHHRELFGELVNGDGAEPTEAVRS
jgi:hypothetical protein